VCRWSDAERMRAHKIGTHWKFWLFGGDEGLGLAVWTSGACHNCSRYVLAREERQEETAWVCRTREPLSEPHPGFWADSVSS
jgi:hypothetical protein